MKLTTIKGNYFKGKAEEAWSGPL